MSLRKPKFSILSLLLLTAVVALVMVNLQQIRLRKIELADSNKRLLEARQRSIELSTQNTVMRQRFEGIHGDPVLMYYSPELYQTPHCLLPNNGFNKKSTHTFSFGDRFKEEVRYTEFDGREVRYQRRRKRQLSVELKLLNSVQGSRSSQIQSKGIDYYRLRFNIWDEIDCWRPPGTDSKTQTRLFEYQGTPKMILNSTELVVVLGPDRASALKVLLEVLPTDQAIKLDARFTERESIIPAHVCKGSKAK